MNEPIYTELKRNSQVIGHIITWKNLKKGAGEWAEAVGTKRSALVTGEFGANGNCKIEGSLDNKTPGTLHYGFGVDINLKNSEFCEINEISRFIRPNVDSGDEKTDLTISIMVIL